MASNRVTASRALLDWSGPIMCSCSPAWRSRSAGHLAAASWTWFSPNTLAPATITGSMAMASNVFDTVTKVTPAGSRPASRQAASISRRTEASAEAGSRVAMGRFIAGGIHDGPILFQVVIVPSRYCSKSLLFQVVQFLIIDPIPFLRLSGTWRGGDAMSSKTTSARAAMRKPQTSIRTRIIILALLLIVPLMVDRVCILISTRVALIAGAVGEVADLAQRGTDGTVGNPQRHPGLVTSSRPRLCGARTWRKGLRGVRVWLCGRCAVDQEPLHGRPERPYSMLDARLRRRDRCIRPDIISRKRAAPAIRPQRISRRTYRPAQHHGGLSGARQGRARERRHPGARRTSNGWIGSPN